MYLLNDQILRHRVLASSTNKVITNLGLIKIRVAMGITYTQKKD